MAKARTVARRERRRPAQLRADNCDKRWLYVRAVQSPDAEIDFVTRVFRAARGRPLRRLREDFAGSAASACEFVRRHPENRAVAIDLHAPTLAWGRKEHLAQLPEAARPRVQLLARNVLRPGREGQGMDAVLAMNFSYWVFQSRAALLEYFRRVHASMRPDGVFFCDVHGGYESFKEMSERRRVRVGGGRWFTYVWDQQRYDPVTGRTRCAIHFEFERGPAMRNAFRYDWRLWTIPEVRELLAEAGFKSATVYLEGDDGKGGGDGVFRPRESGDADASFIGYIVAMK